MFVGQLHTVVVISMLGEGRVLMPVVVLDEVLVDPGKNGPVDLAYVQALDSLDLATVP